MIPIEIFVVVGFGTCRKLSLATRVQQDADGVVGFVSEVVLMRDGHKFSVDSHSCCS